MPSLKFGAALLVVPGACYIFPVISAVLKLEILHFPTNKASCVINEYMENHEGIFLLTLNLSSSLIGARK